MGSLLSTLTLARLQFTVTTVFHMIFPTLTIGLSIMMVVMEILYIRTNDLAYYRHVRFWSRLFILNFAIGVATGLVLEFEFGTNWERFTRMTGGFFGHILGFEGTLAFMVEAAFLGIMVFGWHKVSRGLHLVATIFVAAGATLSGIWILVANSWLQTPSGGYFSGGEFIVQNYSAALFNPDAGIATLHMWIASVETTAFVVGGISAWYILKKRDVAFFTKTLRIALIMALVFTPLQIFVGDRQGLMLNDTQPEKLAALEAHWETNPEGQSAPWNVLAWPDRENARNAWSVQIPGALSLIETHTLTGRVQGLTEWPADERPPIVIPFYAFRVMVLIGFLLFFLMAWTLVVWLRKGLNAEGVLGRPRLMKAWVWAVPLGYIAVETGWLTREVGRQPWLIYRILRTSDAFSQLPAGAVATSLLILIGVYTVLLALFLGFARKIIRQGPDLSLMPPGQAGAAAEDEAGSLSTRKEPTDA